jgi:protein-disulfide isomerase
MPWPIRSGKVNIMGTKYILFLIFCIAVTALITLQTGAFLLEKNDDDALTRVQGETILKQLAEIRTTLERIEKQPRAGARPNVPTTASASTKGRPALGDPEAGVTVVEFTDYQCPFCSRFERSTFKQLKQNYIDTGKVRWVVLDMPLSFHKDALFASQAAHCANEQDKFWELRELFFQNQKKLQPEDIARYAQQVGIKPEAFNTCINSNRYQENIQRDITEAGKQRITGTPTFVIGMSAPDVVSGKRIVGAQHYNVFSSEIEALLKKKG